MNKTLRTVVTAVALLNLCYFGVESTSPRVEQR